MAYLNEAEATELVRVLLEEYSVKDIVDVGVGSSTIALSEGGARNIHAVDIDEDALRQVKGYTHVIPIKADATSMTFPYEALNMAGLGLYFPEVAERVVKNAVDQRVSLIALSPRTEGMHTLLEGAGYTEVLYGLGTEKNVHVYTLK